MPRSQYPVAPYPRRTRRGQSAAYIALFLVATLAAATNGTAATTGIAVSMNLLSTTEIGMTSCQPNVANTTNLGLIPADAGKAGTGDCVVTFGSNDVSSQLRVYQPDGYDRAMYRPVTGALDTTYDTDGRQTLAGLGAYDGAPYPGGDWVVAGETNFSGWQFEIARLSSAGGISWRAQHAWPGCTTNCTAHDVVALADGDIVAVGEYNDGDRDVALMRVTPAGALRTTFGGTGRVTTDSPGMQILGSPAL